MKSIDDWPDPNEGISGILTINTFVGVPGGCVRSRLFCSDWRFVSGDGVLNNLLPDTAHIVGLVNGDVRCAVGANEFVGLVVCEQPLPPLTDTYFDVDRGVCVPTRADAETKTPGEEANT